MAVLYLFVLLFVYRIEAFKRPAGGSHAGSGQNLSGQLHKGVGTLLFFWTRVCYTLVIERGLKRHVKYKRKRPALR